MSEIRVSKIRGSKIRISSNHRELHGAIFIAQNTALHVAADEGHVSAVTMLMTSGAEFKKNRAGERFLDLAIRKEHKDVCVAIISHERYACNTHTHPHVCDCIISES